MSPSPSPSSGRNRITGAAMLAGIAGQPVAHSLSPVIHNAWLEAGNIDGAYMPFAPRDAAGFDALVAAGRAGLVQGLNVTAPFKEQAFALADEASKAAQATGSANILVFQDGRVLADSSDGALQLQVRILNRSRDRAEALAADLGPSVSVADEAALSEADLVINALSVPPAIDLSALKPTAVVMDMTYKPVVTPFLAAARARGLTTVDGLAMLIGQAAPLFTALFHRPPPPLDLRALLLAHLGEAQVGKTA